MVLGLVWVVVMFKSGLWIPYFGLVWLSRLPIFAKAIFCRRGMRLTKEMKEDAEMMIESISWSSGIDLKVVWSALPVSPRVLFTANLLGERKIMGGVIFLPSFSLMWRVVSVLMNRNESMEDFLLFVLKHEAGHVAAEMGKDVASVKNRGRGRLMALSILSIVAPIAVQKIYSNLPWEREANEKGQELFDEHLF